MSAVFSDEATESRCGFIGGSDAAAVLGLSDWTTPVQLWLQKTGLEPEARPDAKRQRVLDRGKKLEPFIVDMLIDKLIDEGHDVEVVATNQRHTDPEFPFLRAEIDVELIVDGEPVNADAKSASGFMRKKWGAEGSDDMPLAYAAQFMHGLMVTGRRRTLCAALIGLDDVLLYWLERDDETIAGMRAKEVEFWHQHVVARVPPDPVRFADLRALHPKDNGRTIEATAEVDAAVTELGKLRGFKRQIEGREEELQLLIARHMGDHQKLTRHGELIATWSTEARTQFLLDDFRRKHKGMAELFTTREATRVLRLPRGRR